MRLLEVISAFVLLLSFNSSTNAQRSEKTSQKIDSIFSSYNSATPGVAIAIVKNGKVVFKKGYGMANLSHRIPITAKTAFNLASVSKQFTAFLIYLMESDGMLSFEDNVRKYIPELPDFGIPVRIRHLLAHTSGIKDHGALASIAGNYVSGDISTNEKNIKLLADTKDLNFEAGSAFGYSNSNYTLLAEIVHRITGKTFAEYAKERIFSPLDMTSTMVCDNYETVIENKAESYELNGNKYHYKHLLESNVGPSNVWTTVEDMCKWALNFETPKVGTPAILAAFNQSSLLDNGAKVFLRVVDGDTIFHAKGQNIWKHKGATIFSHGGHAGAFRTFMGRFPEHSLTIIQLSNDEYNERLGGRWDIADFYIKEHLVENQQVGSTVQAGTKSTPQSENFHLNLNKFAGTYYNDELDSKYYFEVINNQLVMKHKRLYDISLKRVEENRFSGSGPNTFGFEITFLQDSAGVIVGFNISNWGAKNIKFQKLH